MKRISLGKITSAHGVKGLVKILPFGDEPKLIETLGPCYTSESGPEILTITMKNSAGHKYWLASVEGVTERNGAEALRGTELYVARDKLPEIEEDDKFYFADLVGLKTLREDGSEAGEVIAAENFGAGDLIEIRAAGKASFYLPFTDEYVKKVDLETRTIIIDPRGMDE